ncbi:hypothetical protein [Photobacterium satsumensis]|uniref:hypothetical protein n=1 Tax=Photobacterium satsumensis TaxID=2910239 RepID=UPI003D10D102
MKVLIQYTQTIKYKDYAWESLTLRSKGEVGAVTPSSAAQLIKEEKALLFTSTNEDILFHH